MQRHVYSSSDVLLCRDDVKEFLSHEVDLILYHVISRATKIAFHERADILVTQHIEEALDLLNMKYASSTHDPMAGRNLESESLVLSSRFLHVKEIPELRRDVSPRLNLSDPRMTIFALEDSGMANLLPYLLSSFSNPSCTKTLVRLAYFATRNEAISLTPFAEKLAGCLCQVIASDTDIFYRLLARGSLANLMRNDVCHEICADWFSHELSSLLRSNNCVPDELAVVVLLLSALSHPIRSVDRLARLLPRLTSSCSEPLPPQLSESLHVYSSSFVASRFRQHSSPLADATQPRQLLRVVATPTVRPNGQLKRRTPRIPRKAAASKRVTRACIEEVFELVSAEAAAPPKKRKLDDSEFRWAECYLKYYSDKSTGMSRAKAAKEICFDPHCFL